MENHLSWSKGTAFGSGTPWASSPTYPNRDRWKIRPSLPHGGWRKSVLIRSRCVKMQRKLSQCILRICRGRRPSAPRFRFVCQFCFRFTPWAYCGRSAGNALCICRPCSNIPRRLRWIAWGCPCPSAPCQNPTAPNGYLLRIGQCRNFRTPR